MYCWECFFCLMDMISLELPKSANWQGVGDKMIALLLIYEIYCFSNTGAVLFNLKSGSIEFN